ncbi:hydroxypyruvate isomerase family protein [Pseudonocardia nigra]|uniref:hydroxypyruvate isomerase family protein n=1 Tax=Pseudonocardia nigra TaxID=1921578 RepID=UPI0027E2431F|nr:TIM barrel protein [Pseudonocardia nigra]
MTGTGRSVQEKPVTHTLPYAVNCSILFTELPLLQRPAAAREAGFDAVEFWWPFADVVPADREVDAFVTAIRDAGVTLVGLNFAAGDMPAGDRGLVSWPGRETEFRDNVAVTVGIGERLGTGAFNALYGNRLDGVAPEEQDALAVENLGVAAAAAAEIGATVLVEPVSGAPRYPLLRAADALAVIERVERAGGTSNIALLADLYHLTVNGDDVAAVIDEHTGRIGHVQIADAPGRHEPGTGSIDLAVHLAALQARGYTGRVSCEYVPSTTSAESFGWLREEQA